MLSETANLDAQLLAAHLLKRSKTWVLAHPEYPLNNDQEVALEKSLQLLLLGKPLPYILEEGEFYGRKMFVSSDVLIPRPETELLVEHALAWVQKHPECRRVIDVGSGSGCIAVSLAAEANKLEVIATDLSIEALRVAKRNIERYALQRRISLVQCDLMMPLNGNFDLVCANLPYIPSQRLQTLAVARHEPITALDGGMDGFLLIEKLLQQSKTRLSKNGLLLCEIDDTHAELAKHTAERYFNETIEILEDYQGKPRLLRINRK